MRAPLGRAERVLGRCVIGLLALNGLAAGIVGGSGAGGGDGGVQSGPRTGDRSTVDGSSGTAPRAGASSGHGNGRRAVDRTSFPDSALAGDGLPYATGDGPGGLVDKDDLPGGPSASRRLPEEDARVGASGGTGPGTGPGSTSGTGDSGGTDGASDDRKASTPLVSTPALGISVSADVGSVTVPSAQLPGGTAAPSSTPSSTPSASGSVTVKAPSVTVTVPPTTLPPTTLPPTTLPPTTTTTVVVTTTTIVATSTTIRLF